MKSKLLSILTVFFFLLSACAPAETPSRTAKVEEKPVETEAVAEVQHETDECIACHTDKQLLIDTADPVMEAESESSGVG